MKLEDLKDISKNDILAALGLETKESTASWLLGSLAVFGVGVLVGAGTALLLAPKAGRELRDDIGSRLKTVRNTANELTGAQT